LNSGEQARGGREWASRRLRWRPRGNGRSAPDRCHAGRGRATPWAGPGAPATAPRGRSSRSPEGRRPRSIAARAPRRDARGGGDAGRTPAVRSEARASSESERSRADRVGSLKSCASTGSPRERHLISHARSPDGTPAAAAPGCPWVSCRTESRERLRRMTPERRLAEALAPGSEGRRFIRAGTRNRGERGAAAHPSKPRTHAPLSPIRRLAPCPLE